MSADYAPKPLIVPPDASRVVMAALVDTIDLDSIWEVSLMDLAKPVSLDLMARAERGYLDKLGQTSAVWSPVNAYFIQFEPLVLAAASPADRQFAARWAARKPGGALMSSYLSSGAGAVGSQTPSVMAIDLQDATCAPKVQGRLLNEKFDAL